MLSQDSSTDSGMSREIWSQLIFPLELGQLQSGVPVEFLADAGYCMTQFKEGAPLFLRLRTDSISGDRRNYTAARNPLTERYLVRHGLLSPAYVFPERRQQLFFSGSIP